MKAVQKLKCGGSKKSYAKGGKKKKSNYINGGNKISSFINDNQDSIGNISSATHALSASQAENKSEAQYEAALAGVSKAGPIGAVIGGATSIVDSIAKPIREKAEEKDRFGNIKDFKKAKRLHQFGSNINPLKAGIETTNDPNASPLEKIMAFTGFGGITGTSKRQLKDQEEIAKAEASKGYFRDAINYMDKTSFHNGGNKGGEIHGKGGPKSDSIKLTAKDGSFFVPAENAEHANSLGREYLGWSKNKTAKKDNGGSEVNVSNGEVIFTPEEVGTLRYYGIDLNELAPNADADKKLDFDQGGLKDSEDLIPVDKSKEILDFAKETQDTSVDLKNERINKLPKLKDWAKYAPELASTIQAVGGASGLMAAGKKPDLTISKSLEKLSAETRRLSNFGYEPAVLNSLNNQIENVRRDISKSATDSGGSPMVQMAKLQNLLSTTIDKKAGLTFSNAQEKSRKWADSMRVDLLKSGQEFDINKTNISDWKENQGVFSELLSAGISNLIGARQLKEEQKTIKEIGNSNPTFS